MMKTSTYFTTFLLTLLLALLTACASNPRTNGSLTSEMTEAQRFRTTNPSVSADSAVNLINWTYTPPWEFEDNRRPADNEIISIDEGYYEGWLKWNDGGFDLVWSDYFCSTAPTLIIHADATMEFWPGDIVGEDCDAMAVAHKLSVQLQTDVPPEDWQFTLHPPER